MKRQSKAMQKKWDQRHRAVTTTVPDAALVLKQNLHLLPVSGDALDLACGRGGNALLLAQAGLTVQAWDLSPVAVEALQLQAEVNGVAIQATVRDVLELPPFPESFDVIVVSHFLQRSLMPTICEALRPCGLLFYQTFSQDKVSLQGPNNPDFLLAENELLRLCAPLRLRVYREEGTLGDTTHGLRNEVLYVGQKVASQ